MRGNEAAKVAEELMPHIIKRLNRNNQGISTTPATVSTVPIDTAKAALEAHKALDFVDAHRTNDPSVNHHRTYYSVNFGIVGGTGVDESNNIINMLEIVGAAGGGVCVISATDYTDPVIYIEKTISIYHDNVHVVVDPATFLGYGAQGCLRIMGSLDEFTRKLDGTAMKLHVNSTVNGSNQTILELSATDTALMDAEAIVANRIVVRGDKIVVRGVNDISGRAIQKDTTFVDSLAKVGSYWQITCTDELDYTFQPWYGPTPTLSTPIGSSDWGPDATTGTTIYIVRYGTIATDLPAGSVSAVVNSVTGFAPGDVIQGGDSRTENAYNASALKGDGTPYANPAALELLSIIAVDTGTKTIYFDRATTRTYKAGSPYYGGIARCVMVRNSSIAGVRIAYHAANTSTSYNALQMTYAVECEIHHCTVNGYTYVDGTLTNDFGRSGHALRMSYALNCKAYNNTIRNCLYSDSGRGYGITDYYSTGNQIYANVISGCRHNILLQLSTNAIIHGNESRNHLISGIDAHGVNSYGAHIYGNTITQANGITTDSTQAAGIRIGNTSHSVGDHYMVVEDNVFIYNSGTSDQAFDWIANSSHLIFRNNTVLNANIGAKFTLNSKQITPVQTATDITLEGNRFIGCLNGALSITGQPTYDNVNSNGKLDGLYLINNTADGCAVAHFKVTGVVTTSGISNVRMENNRILNDAAATTVYAYQVSNVAGLLLLRNSARGAQRGFSLTNCTSAAAIDNDLTGLITGPAYTDGGGNTSILLQGNHTDTGVGYGTLNPDSGLTVDSGDIHARYSANTRYQTGMGAVSGKGVFYAYDTTAGAYIDALLDGVTIALRPAGHDSLATVIDSGGNMTVHGAASAYRDNANGQAVLAGATNPAKNLLVGYDTTNNRGIIQALTQAVGYDGLALNPNGGAVTVNGNAIGGVIIYTRVDGTLTASQVSSAVIAHNNSTPTITDGLQTVSVSYTPGATGRRIRVEGFIPYISVGTTIPVQVNLWAGSTCFAMTTSRVTTGGSTGNGIYVVGDFVSTGISALTIQMRCGPDTAANITFNSKFNGLSQPYMIIQEHA